MKTFRYIYTLAQDGPADKQSGNLKDDFHETHWIQELEGKNNKNKKYGHNAGKSTCKYI